MTVQLSAIPLATSPYKVGKPLSLGVQVPAPLCRVYLDPGSCVCIGVGSLVVSRIRDLGHNTMHILNFFLDNLDFKEGAICHLPNLLVSRVVLCRYIS